MQNNTKFYNQVSAYYDRMIDFNSALKKRTEFLRGFVNSEMKSAADIGCGTGMDSISLSQLGLDVTSFDPSSEMINTARVNAKNYNVKIKLNNYTTDKISKNYYDNFDLVVSLGNTLANIPDHQINKSISILHKMLKKDGKILIQILNYEKILKDKERIVNITKKDNDYFIRFYDFGSKNLVFNILKFNTDHTTKKELISTKIYPHIAKKLMRIFKNTGFKKIELYGSLNRETYDAKTSNDVILFAAK